MKLSSILMICGGSANIVMACNFVFISFQSKSTYAAGLLILFGVLFAIVGIGSFLSSRYSDKTAHTAVSIIFITVAVIELLFSLPFLFFAFAGGYMLLLEYGIPLLFASIFLLVGSALKCRETKQRRMKEQKPRRHPQGCS